MKILAHEDIKLTLEDLRNRRPISRPPAPLKRAPGVHLTGVLRQWALEKEILAVSEWEEEEEDHYPLLWMLGQAVEEFWASLMVSQGMIWQPGELQRDGVSGNPDGVSTHYLKNDYNDVGRIVIEEHKVTKRSCRDGKDVPGLNDRASVIAWWSRIQQVLGYCNMHPESPVLARFHVLYLNADYRGIEPVYRRTLVEFSEFEKQSNWMNVKKFSRRTKPE